MRIKEIKLYMFDELSDLAKGRARDWFRKGNLDYDWWDSTYEDAERIGLTIKAFDLGRGSYVDGRLSGSMKDTIAKILTEHGHDCDTYKLALEFLPSVEKEDEEVEEDEETVKDFTQRLCEEYRIMLQHELEYLESKEHAEESIIANEYEFTEDGNRA